eukprot:TRINITY_DN2941_c0_g3_i2.p1 TRINITY_DN2941_c0_g3~~TRINITY_DN2941_c0_g3_i2.p1  ORF type:complete len:148 (+),score=23.72 TRINITY_DN2941_c0_g3_i2:421-864(+)
MSFFKSLDRSFVDEQDLKTRERSAKKKTCHVILFSDVLLICKIRNQKLKKFSGKRHRSLSTSSMDLSPTYQLKELISLSTLWTVERLTGSGECLVKLTCPSAVTPTSWSLYFDLSGTCGNWYDSMTKVCKPLDITESVPSPKHSNKK